MPRGTNSSDETVDRAERPRRPRVRTSEKSALVSRPRSVRTSKPKVTDAQESISASEVTLIARRKAPTTIPSTITSKQFVYRYRNQLLVAALLLVSVGASAGVGYTDTGAIDVNEVIAARNERIAAQAADNATAENPSTPSEVATPEIVPVSTRIMRPRGIGSQSAAPTESIQATTTVDVVETSTSSDDGLGEDRDTASNDLLSSEQDEQIIVVNEAAALTEPAPEDSANNDSPAE